MASISLYSKLALPQATPAAVGEIAITPGGQLQVHNGSTVDTYVSTPSSPQMDFGQITGVPTTGTAGTDSVNPYGLQITSSVTGRVYTAASAASNTPIVLGSYVIFQPDSSGLAYILGRADGNSLSVAVTLTDWNTAINTGAYQGVAGSQSNSPNNAVAWMGHVEVHSATYVLQTVTNFNAANITRQTWERALVNGAWTAWRLVYGSDMPLTLIGAGGSSFGASVAAYPSTYSVPAMQKQAGVVTLSGMFNTSAAIASASAVCTLPTSLLPAFTSGRTSMMIGEATSSPAGLALRFSIDSTGKVAYNALVAGNSIASGNNFMMNFHWPAAT